jgi:hypothetical protein
MPPPSATNARLAAMRGQFDAGASAHGAAGSCAPHRRRFSGRDSDRRGANARNVGT